MQSVSATTRYDAAKALEASARNAVYSDATRSKLGEAAAAVQTGKLSPEAALAAAVKARSGLIEGFRTGRAFAASVPVETRAARANYVVAQAAALIPWLRQSGQVAIVASLEGARAAADFAAVGRVWTEASNALALASAQTPPVYLQVQSMVDALAERARPYDKQWIEAGLADQENVHWYRGYDSFRRTYVVPPAITPDPHNANRLRIGCGLNILHEVLCKYAIERKGDAFIVRRMGAGFDPGEAFRITQQGATKVGYENIDSMPTVGSHGGLAWTSPRHALDERVALEMDPTASVALTALLDEIAAYLVPRSVDTKSA